MRSAALVCASPHHDGDRLIRDRLDAVEKRHEYRRVSDQGRERVELLYVCCKACMRAEIEAARPAAPPTGSLFDGTLTTKED